MQTKTTVARSPRRPSALFIILLLALGLTVAPSLVAPVSPASAHGGDMELQLSQDGTGLIQVAAKYIEDGHPVVAVINPEMTAVAADGSLVGPVAMVSAPEGEGFWVAEGAPLTAGDWTVTVRVTDPVAAEVTQDVAVVIADQTPPDTATEGGATDAVRPILLAAGAAALVAIALTIAVFVVRRSRRQRGTSV